MATRDDTFELRLGRIGRDHAPNLKRVRAAVRQASGIARGPKARVAPRTGLRAHFRKGSAAKVRVAPVGQRRVVVKARYAMHGAGKGAPLSAHVRYLAREAKVERSEPGLERSVDYLQREETPGNAHVAFYDRDHVGVDGKAVTAGWAEDGRHFRLIVSAEDGEALGDLKPFIREMMEGLEAKLGTKLEWIAVDHHDTDNPHTHILIRGRRLDGQDLFIPSRLISSGIREHAEEIVARALGPRIGVDLVKERQRDIGRAAVTHLDRERLAGLERDGVVPANRPDLIARLERLERWDLAQRSIRGWTIAEGLFEKLDALKDYRAVEQAVAPHRRRGDLQPLLAADPLEPVSGQLVHLGAADEFGDSFLAVLETGRGELRYARFEKADDLARLRGVESGAIVMFEPNQPVVRPSDQAIAHVADRIGGLYSVSHHLALEPHVSRPLADANVRRLEAMRRVGLVQRSADGVFTVGPDHLKRAMMFEERVARRFPLSAIVASYLTLDEQVTALGPTHLDRVLAGEAAPTRGEGAFARQHAQALQQR